MCEQERDRGRGGGSERKKEKERKGERRERIPNEFSLSCGQLFLLHSSELSTWNITDVLERNRKRERWREPKKRTIVLGGGGGGRYRYTLGPKLKVWADRQHVANDSSFPYILLPSLPFPYLRPLLLLPLSKPSLLFIYLLHPPPPTPYPHPLLNLPLLLPNYSSPPLKSSTTTHLHPPLQPPPPYSLSTSSPKPPTSQFDISFPLPTSYTLLIFSLLFTNDVKKEEIKLGSYKII